MGVMVPIPTGCVGSFLIGAVMFVLVAGSVLCTRSLFIIGYGLCTTRLAKLSFGSPNFRL